MAESRYNIVIVGGNLSGVPVAHYLLKHIIPALLKVDSTKSYHVTIISPSSHYFWKPSTPRVLAQGHEEQYAQIFRPIVKGFAKYPDTFTHVQGRARSVDPSARTVTVEKNDSSQESIHYDSLVIATGCMSASPLWSLHDDHTQSLDALKSIRQKLSTAKTILISGGGAVGVESATEIAASFPAAKITILSGSERLLLRTTNSAGKAAERALHRLGVEVIHNVKTVDSEPTDNGQTKVRLDDGSEQVVDVYVNGAGASPNSDWIPSEWLNEKKRVKVYGDSLRVKGPNSDRVYAVGDIADYSGQTWMDVKFAIAPVSSNIGADILKTLDDGNGKSVGLVSSVLGYIPLLGSALGAVLSPRKFRAPVMFFIPLGGWTGTGTMLGLPALGLVVAFTKGRSYFIEDALSEWNGSAIYP